MRFLVPSRKDRDWWLRRAGRDQYGPAETPSFTLWTWQDLYDDLCASLGVRRRRPLSPPDHLLILRRILDEVLEENPELSERWPGLKRSGFLDVLSNDVHELLNEAVRPGHMEAVGEETSPAGPAKLLPEVYRRYLAYLEENILLDSAQICMAAAELLHGAGDWGRDFTPVFTGFLSFTHSQLELVRGLITRCRDVVILKPETRLPKLYDVAGQLAEYAEQPELPDAGGYVADLPAAEPGLEPEVIARSLALWSDGQGELASIQPFPGFSNIGLMASSSTAETMISALERYSVPFTQEAGRSIAQTLPGQILASVRSLKNMGFPVYGTALLLTQPCFAGAAAEFLPGQGSFSTVNALRAGPAGLSEWEKYLEAAKQDEPVRLARLAIRAIGTFCRKISGGGRPVDLMDAFCKFLTVRGLWLDLIGEQPYAELDETVRTTASAIETIKEKALALRELLPDLGPVGQEKLKGESAFDFLETWCRQSNTRPPLPLRGAVHLYVGHPPVLASHPVWVMLGVTQQTWPGHIPGSPLLDAAERERLDRNGAHLPSSHDKAMQREALFRRLVQTGESLTVLSRSELDEDDHPLERSPFVERFQKDMKGWSLVSLPLVPIDVLTGGDDYLFPDIDPETSISGRTPPVIHDAVEGPMGLGVSDLKELLSCPALWWLRRRGRLRERTLELATAADWGTLTHVLWQKVWQRFRDIRDAEQFPPIVQEEWTHLVSGEGPYEPFRHFTGDRRLQRRLENFRFRVLRLGKIQGQILERLYQAGFTHREIRLEEEAQLSLELEGITFTGQCDRIEVLEDRAGCPCALITDYKEGRAEKYEKGMSVMDCPWNTSEWEKFRFGLQLSAYAVMFEHEYPEIPLAGVSFLGMEDGRLAGSFTREVQSYFAPECDSPRKLAVPLREREDEAEYAMQHAASLLRAGEFRPFYGSDLCRTCGMKGVCRRSEFCGESLLEDEDTGGPSDTSD
ncbi:MAG: PD-(D/E)XK nuclease family protein [Fretibacterium sp.]|nr:PD-(D/E)XK nuclease family protein [Fretibacterium sp.]